MIDVHSDYNYFTLVSMEILSYFVVQHSMYYYYVVNYHINSSNIT